MTELNKHFTTRKTVLEQTPLVQERNEQVVTTSLIVAEEFGMKHKKVIKKIKKLIKHPQINEMFREGSYTDKRKGKERLMYYMDQDGFAFLAAEIKKGVPMQLKVKFHNQFVRAEKNIEVDNLSDYSEGSRLERFEAALKSIETLSKTIDMSEGDKLELIVSVHEEFSLPTRHITEVIGPNLLMTLEKLLDTHKTDMTYSEVKAKLMYHDFLDIDTAPTCDGDDESFPVLTKKGLVFGKNVSRSDEHFWLTEPYFYEKKFPILLELLEQVKSSGDDVGED